MIEISPPPGLKFLEDKMTLSYLKNEYVTLYVYFKNQNGQYVNVDNPSVVFKNKSNLVEVFPIILVPLERVNNEDIGYYHINFLSTGLEATTYLVEFKGNQEGTQVLLNIPGEFALFNTPTIQVYIDELRLMLNDYLTNRYRIEDTKVNLWEDKELFQSLKTSLFRMRTFPPILSQEFTFDNIAEGEGLLIEGGIIFSLFTRAILEVTNEFQYSDELSLAIKRSDSYRGIAKDLMTDWDKNVRMYKTNLQFKRTKPIAVKTARMPMVGRFILSMLPNRQVIFGRY